MTLQDELARATTSWELVVQLMTDGASPQRLTCDIDDVTVTDLPRLPRLLRDHVAVYSRDAEVLDELARGRSCASPVAAANPACPLAARQHVLDDWMADTYGQEGVSEHLDTFLHVGRHDPALLVADYLEDLEGRNSRRSLVAILDHLAANDAEVFAAVAAHWTADDTSPRRLDEVVDVARQHGPDAAMALLERGVTAAALQQRACTLQVNDLVGEDLIEQTAPLFERILTLADAGLIQPATFAAGRFPMDSERAARLRERGRPAELLWLVRSAAPSIKTSTGLGPTDLPAVLDAAAAAAEGPGAPDDIHELVVAAAAQLLARADRVSDGLSPEQEAQLLGALDNVLRSSDGEATASIRGCDALTAAALTAATVPLAPAEVDQLLARASLAVVEADPVDRADHLLAVLLRRVLKLELPADHPAYRFLVATLNSDRAALDALLPQPTVRRSERLLLQAAPSLAVGGGNDFARTFARMVAADVADGRLRPAQVATVFGLLDSDWHGTYEALIDTAAVLSDAPTTASTAG